MDQPFFDRHDCPRLERVVAREIIPVGSILGAKLIQIIIWKERPVGRLPRTDVHLSDSHRILWFSRP
jgi:hypothetical protein